MTRNLLDLKETFDNARGILGDKEIVAIDLSVENGIRETTVTPMECLKRNDVAPPYRTYESDGTQTITIVIRSMER